MMSSPASSNNTDKAVLLWDEWYVYRWGNDKNESLTPIASLKELPQVSQILQLDTNDIVVLSAQSDTISYVNLHSRTAEVLLCNDEGCCSQSDSERCHQQSNSSQISEISLNSQDHVSVYFSDNAAIKKFQIDDSIIQPEVVVDLNHMDHPGNIIKFTFNEDYSIIFLLWERLDNEKNLLYWYHIHRKTMSGYIKIQEKLANILSLGENIILGLDEKHNRLLAIDYKHNSSSRVCLVIYAMDSANNILAIDNIKGLYIKIDIANNNCHVLNCANSNTCWILEGGFAGENLISLMFGILQPYRFGGRGGVPGGLKLQGMI